MDYSLLLGVEILKPLTSALSRNLNDPDQRLSGPDPFESRIARNDPLLNHSKRTSQMSYFVSEEFL